MNTTINDIRLSQHLLLEPAREIAGPIIINSGMQTFFAQYFVFWRLLRIFVAE